MPQGGTADRVRARSRDVAEDSLPRVAGVGEGVAVDVGAGAGLLWVQATNSSTPEATAPCSTRLNPS